MDINKLLNIVKDQFIDEDLDSITITTKFRTLKSFDSLTAMAILSAVEDEYKISLPVEKFKNITTIEELHKYIINQS